MDIVLIIFIILVLLFSSYTVPKKQFEDYLSLDSTLGLRGVMAVSIILHHMSDMVHSGILFPMIVHIGYLIVAVFFFLSGYGLFVSYKKKGSDYLKGFWKSRILSLFIVYLIVCLIYYIIRCANGEVLSLIEVLKLFNDAKPIATYSWYIIVQLILYFFFWVAFSLKKLNDNLKIAIVVILEIGLLMLLKSKGFGGTWYISNFAFPMGMLWSEYKEKIDELLKKRYFIFVLVSSTLFAIFTVMPKLSSSIGISTYLIGNVVSSCAFVAVVMAALRLIKPSKKFWNFLGSISLEIYLIHGAVLFAVNNIISNSVIWTFVSIILSIAAAYLLNLVNKPIFKLLKKNSN